MSFKKIDNKWLVAYLMSLGIPSDHHEQEGSRIYFFFTITPQFDEAKNEFFGNEALHQFINEYYKIVGVIKERKPEELTGKE